MTPENQQRILALTSRLASEIGHALERQPITVEEGAEFLQTHGNKPVFQLLLEAVQKLVPTVAREGSLTFEDIPKVLPLFATQESVEAVLLQLPDPDPFQLDALEYELPSAVLRLRGILLPFVKRLPGPVGRRKKLESPAERQSVRDRIGLLLAQGVELPIAQERVRLQEEKRLREDVSLITIQRAWREVKKPKHRRRTTLQ